MIAQRAALFERLLGLGWKYLYGGSPLKRQHVHDIPGIAVPPSTPPFIFRGSIGIKKPM